jgi:hypothetical protein
MAVPSTSEKLRWESNPRRVNQPETVSQPAEITQLLFQSASKLDFAHFRAPVSDGGPKDRRFRDDAHGLFDR